MIIMTISLYIYSMVLNICAIKYHDYYIMMSSWKVVLLNSVRLYVLLQYVAINMRIYYVRQDIMQA